MSIAYNNSNTKSTLFVPTVQHMSVPQRTLVSENDLLLGIKSYFSIPITKITSLFCVTFEDQVRKYTGK
jgi:hypothetical protein